MLLEKGVKTTSKTRACWDKLMISVIYNHPKVLKQLIAAGASVDNQDKDGNTQHCPM